MDIASALVFLHTKGLVHLDIKSLNILLGQGRKEAKLADLGLARLVKEGNLDLLQTLPGTPAYSAPEVMRAQIQWRLRQQGQKGLFSTEVGSCLHSFRCLADKCLPKSWHAFLACILFFLLLNR